MRTVVMGILNVTPDSFADGGRFDTTELAIAHGLSMMQEGADIIDVGGESTRPGAERVSEEQENARVIPVITELVNRGAVVSVDTMRSTIAAAAIAAGARYINDVSGGLADPQMAPLLAKNSEIQYIAMHWRGHSRDMQDAAVYEDVVAEVKNELEERVHDLVREGISPEQIILDPGLGFAKLPEHNWEILRNIERFQLMGYPILIGHSRKSFLGHLLGGVDPDGREAASIAITTLMAEAGIWGVRTHGVRAHKDAISAVEMMRS
jgi:dihydropteroate synthase